MNARLLPVVLGLVALLAASPSLRGEDWPQWLGPKRDGSTTEKVPVWTEKAPPKVAWKKPVHNGFAAPIVAGGKLFVHARGGDVEKEEEEVVAFDAATGDVVWTDTYARPKFSSVLGTGPRAAPTVAGRRLFKIGINGVLTCYDTTTGKARWRKNLYEELKADLPNFAVCCSPLVVGNRVILSIGGKGKCVVALHVDTGEILWQALDDDASTSSPILFAAGERPRGSAPDVVFMTPLRLVGLDPIDGTLRWERAMVFQPQGTSPTPVAFRDRIIASTQAHGALAVQVKQSETGATAAESWQDAKAKSYFSSGVTLGRYVLLVTNVVEVLPSASLVCLDGETGKQLWTKTGVGYFHAGLVRTGDNKLLLLSDGGKLSLLDIEESGAKVLCTTMACNGTLVNPILAGGRLYVRDAVNVSCLEFAKEETTKPNDVCVREANSHATVRAPPGGAMILH